EGTWCYRKAQRRRRRKDSGQGRVEERECQRKGSGLLRVWFRGSGPCNVKGSRAQPRASGIVRGRQAWSRVCRAESRRRILDLVCEQDGTLICGRACACEFYPVEDTDCSYSICDKD